MLPHGLRTFRLYIFNLLVIILKTIVFKLLFSFLTKAHIHRYQPDNSIWSFKKAGLADTAPNTRAPCQQRALSAFSTVGCRCLLCASNCHEFARSLEASYPCFFVHQVLRVPATPVSPKCTQAKKPEIFFRPARDIPYKYSGHSCLKNLCKCTAYSFIPSPNRTVHYRKINACLHTQREGYSFHPQTVTPQGAEPQTSKLWPPVLRSSLETTSK